MVRVFHFVSKNSKLWEVLLNQLRLLKLLPQQQVAGPSKVYFASVSSPAEMVENGAFSHVHPIKPGKLADMNKWRIESPLGLNLYHTTLDANLHTYLPELVVFHDLLELRVSK